MLLLNYDDESLRNVQVYRIFKILTYDINNNVLIYLSICDCHLTKIDN